MSIWTEQLQHPLLGGYYQEQEPFAPEPAARERDGEFAEPNEFTKLLLRDLTDEELMLGGAYSSWLVFGIGW